MPGAMGTALEWALALSRAPMERHALRQRGLPGGIEAVLAIAADAAPGQLEQAVRASGESAAAIREAAQFYVREILLFPAADAYRTLGVAHGADPATIKSHHRLLQHWLHPDRAASAEDAVFAARVNTAWNRLRHPGRRQAYDAALAAAVPAPARSASQQVPAGWRGAQAALPAAATGRWQRAMVIALVAVSAVLGLLAWQEQGRHPDHSEDGLDVAATTASTSEAGMIDALIALPQPATKPPPQVLTTSQSQAQARTQLPRTPSVATSGQATPPQTLAMAASAPPRQTQPVVSEVTPAPAPSIALASERMPPRVVPPPPPSDPRPDPRPADARLAAMVALPPLPSRDTRARTAAVAALPSPARIESARRIGQQLLRYMAERNRPPPPIWNSPAIESSAGQLRDALQATGALQLLEPEWRIGEGTAAMSAGFRPSGTAAAAGKVSADLVWREGQWLVVGLSLERSH